MQGKSGYQYREIICGYCNHRFVFNKNAQEWQWHTYLKPNGIYGIETKCPKCGEELVSFDDETTALPFVLRDDCDTIKVSGFKEI